MDDKMAPMFMFMLSNNLLNPVIFCWKDREMKTHVKRLYCKQRSNNVVTVFSTQNDSVYV